MNRRLLVLLAVASATLGCPRSNPPVPATPASVGSAVPAPPVEPAPKESVPTEPARAEPAAVDTAALAALAALPPFEFRPTDCTVPVVYLLESRDGAPSPDALAQALFLDHSDVSWLRARPAPYMTVRTLTDALAFIQLIRRAVSHAARTRLRQLMDWLRQKSPTFVGIQLEPGPIAADGTAWLRARAALTASQQRR